MGQQPAACGKRRGEAQGNAAQRGQQQQPKRMREAEQSQDYPAVQQQTVGHPGTGSGVDMTGSNSARRCLMESLQRASGNGQLSGGEASLQQLVPQALQQQQQTPALGYQQVSVLMQWAQMINALQQSLVPPQAQR